MKVIVLNSLSHSGSTVLSMVLSSSQNAISLGEIYLVLRDDPDNWLEHNKTCSCNNSTDSCAYWNLVLNFIKENQINDITERYKYALEFFESVYGYESILIDTSKGCKHFTIYNNLKIDYKVIYLIRDVRSFSFSQSKVAFRQKRTGLKKIKGKVWFQYLKWYFGNKKRLNKFKSDEVQYYKIGYEDFCFNQAERLIEICNYIDIEYKDNYLSMTNAKHHILMGNPMRHQKNKQTSINYDASWLSDTRNAIPSTLFRFITSYNNKNVYRKS